MADGFTEMFDRAQAFYAALAANNSRDWFEPRKAGWKADVEAPAKLLAELMADELSRRTGTPHGGKVFRINRDVRFSRDKSPYKTSLAMMWAPVEEGEAAAGAFYFAIHPDRAVVGYGTPGYDREALTRYRAMVDKWGAQLAELIEEAGAHPIPVGPEPLKRVPKPFDPDHPQADLLKLKALALGVVLPEEWREDGLFDGLVAGFERLMPVRDFLVARL